MQTSEAEWVQTDVAVIHSETWELRVLQANQDAP